MSLPAELIQTLRSLLAAPGGRVAVLGEAPGDPGTLFGAGDVERVADPEAFRSRSGAYRAIVLGGRLGREEWDRWTLQLAHHALEDGGGLLVDAPNLMAPLSPANAAFLFGRVTARLGRAAAKALGGGRGPRRFAGRRYEAAGLRAMIESLGFDVRHWSTTGPGGDRFRILAVKRPSANGLLRYGGFPDCAAHAASFEAAQRPFLTIRERWLAAHADFAPDSAEPLDPSRYAGAEVLVLAPHPDDEIIGCGGTLRRLIQAGARVTAVQATDGAASVALNHEPDARRRQVRLDEAQAVADAIGFADVEYWREPNGAFVPTEACAERLHALLGRLDPALILTPFVTDIHEEHLVLNRILASALERGGAGGAQVMGYEVWSLLPANAWCDVTEVTRFQEALLWRYVTAMKVDDFVQFCEARNFHHACTHLKRNGFVEAFHVVPASRFPALVATVPTAPVLPT